MSTPIITQIRAIPVNIPYRTTPVMSAGASAYSSRTVIIVETSEGLHGIGEAAYGFPAQIIERELAPALVGLDALDLAMLRRHCLPDVLDFGTPSLRTRLAAWGGVELALWDLLGKFSELPLYRLLGGACRKQAPFGCYAYAEPGATDPVESMAKRAKADLEASGSSIFEFKVGVYPVEVEIEVVKAVHEAVGGRAQIAVDANMGMAFDTARRFLREVAPFLENFEEPVPHLAQMARLAREFNISVSTHCSDLDAVLAHPEIDVVPTLDVCGGVSQVRRISETVSALGRRVWLRSHAESGIGWAAMVHLGMSLRPLERPAQALIDSLEDDLVIGERWSVRHGGVRPPERPGLGVELDWDAVQRYHERYRKMGDVQAFPPTPDRERR
jgi:glucarate dehydratase